VQPAIPAKLYGTRLLPSVDFISRAHLTDENPRVLISRSRSGADGERPLRRWRMLLELALAEGIGARIAGPPGGKGEPWVGPIGGQSSRVPWGRLWRMARPGEARTHRLRRSYPCLHIVRSISDHSKMRYPG
jgi:hypothetical protein